jgi:tRNA G18 (ribose-2'-O)-methylase SpoU
VQQRIMSEGIREGYVVVPASLTLRVQQTIMPIVNGCLLTHMDLNEPQESSITRSDAETVSICSMEGHAMLQDLQLARERALNDALAKLGIDSSLFQQQKFDTSSATRVYEAYVYPRERGLVRLQEEALARSAMRTAQQIDFMLREQRAQEAEYLRNTDYFESAERERHTHPIALVLDNVRSAYNVGSLFRTAETAGATEVVTCGITCRPTNPKLAKTALSATDNVPSKHFDDTLEAVHYLQSENYTVVCMETTSKSVTYTDVQYPPRVALVLGNEMLGVDTRVMDRCDLLVQIPTFGVKNSLNVACAAPVVMFEVLRQWRV